MGTGAIEVFEPEVDLGVMSRPRGPRLHRRYSTRSVARRLSCWRPCSRPELSRNTIADPRERPSPSTAQVYPVASGHADQAISSFSSAIASRTCGRGRSTMMPYVHLIRPPVYFDGLIMR